MKPIGNAGCLLKYNGLMLFVRDKKSNKWCLPGGKPEKGETADQTAIRETKEETGLNVSVESLLYFVADNGGFYLYHCNLINPKELNSRKVFKIPTSAKEEVSSIQFLDPHSLILDDVRFPDFFPTLTKIFDLVPDSTI